MIRCLRSDHESRNVILNLDTSAANLVFWKLWNNQYVLVSLEFVRISASESDPFQLRHLALRKIIVFSAGLILWPLVGIQIAQLLISPMGKYLRVLRQRE